MDIFDLLACPSCRGDLDRKSDSLYCSICQQTYPVVDGKPILFVDGRMLEVIYQDQLHIRESYDPWIHRMVLQSLLDNHIVLELGSGNQALDDPCIIKMDIFLSPYVDVVADAHHLPFKNSVLDFVFSLAVFEHLRNPFQASGEIHRVLKDGGLIYHECNFIFGYHGYPHHYFNTSLQGMEQVFDSFNTLRSGVAPYQMPSFALENIINTYMVNSRMLEFGPKKLFRKLVKVLEEDLPRYDIFFDEDSAARIAAGVYYSGYKNTTGQASLVPDFLLDIYKSHADLQQRFPEVNNLTTRENLLLWARNEGRERFPKVGDFLDQVEGFNKWGPGVSFSRHAIKGLPIIEPNFGAVGTDPTKSMRQNAEEWGSGFSRWVDQLQYRGFYLLRIIQREGMGGFLRRIRQRLDLFFRKRT